MTTMITTTATRTRRIIMVGDMVEDEDDLVIMNVVPVKAKVRKHVVVAVVIVIISGLHILFLISRANPANQAKNLITLHLLLLLIQRMVQPPLLMVVVMKSMTMSMSMNIIIGVIQHPVPSTLGGVVGVVTMGVVPPVNICLLLLLVVAGGMVQLLTLVKDVVTVEEDITVNTVNAEDIKKTEMMMKVKVVVLLHMVKVVAKEVNMETITVEMQIMILLHHLPPHLLLHLLVTLHCPLHLLHLLHPRLNRPQFLQPPFMPILRPISRLESLLRLVLLNLPQGKQDLLHVLLLHAKP